MPAELILSPEHNRERSLGWFLVAWVEHFGVHGPGDIEGEPVLLDDDKTRFYVDAYALDQNGRRLYSTVARSRPKGEAKSEDAGFIVLAEAFAPVRFERWAHGGETYTWMDFEYEYQPGEPIGRPVRYPYIRCLATEENQAGNTYDNVYYNLTEGPLQDAMPRRSAGLELTRLPDGGEIVPSSASSASKDGGKETCAVFDEPHLYVTPELHRMYKTVDRNLRKRKKAEPWALLPSTMYQTGEKSVLEKVHERAKLIAEGKLRGRQRLMWDHREAPAEVDLTDRAAIKAALAEAYGPFAAHIDLDGIVDDEFWNPEKDPEESRRFFFNQPTADRDAWVTKPQFGACAEPDLEIPETEPMAMFFDGSKSSDATGLVGCDIETGHVMTLAAWEKPPGPAGEGWMVDRSDVDATVDRIFEERNVVAFFADVKEFESYVDKWGRKYGDRLIIPASTGKYAHPVAWDMRGKVYEFTSACEQTYAEIEDGELTHDGDGRLERHVLNARRRPNRYGVSIAKETRYSMRKIDLCVCMIGARLARRLVLASPEWKKRNEPKKRKRPGRVVGWS